MVCRNFYLSVVLFMVSFVYADDRRDVEQFINEIYSNYGKSDGSLGFFNMKLDTVLALELLRLIQKDKNPSNKEGGFLDWDPLCSCQDDNGLKIDKIVIQLKFNKIQANVTLQFPTEKREVILFLLKEGKKILIYDIGEPPSFSLLKFLLEKLDNLK